MIPSEDNLSVQDAMRRLAVSLDRADSVFATLDRLAQANPLARLDTTLARADTLVRGATTGSERLLTRLDDASRQLAHAARRGPSDSSGTIDTTIAEARPGLTSTQREALETLARDPRRSSSSCVRRSIRAAASTSWCGTSAPRRRTSLGCRRGSSAIRRACCRRRALPAKPSGPPIRD